eukprot:TRINITY_DN6479_c0_g1_i1.p2 TRINITY_DN6479_c0_g1~~TRINITY_DN6479_c0_g1_i1.p2  ORF type:complete len:224 (+),score=83.11 TRINITY_DN6479_c0_g1_i1:671-1342(+)
MRKYPNDAPAMLGCVAALATLAASPVYGQKLIGGAGMAMPLLINAMLRHYNARELQEHGLRAIGNFCVGDAAEAHVVAMLGSGVVRALLDAMAAFGTSAKVQRAALAALVAMQGVAGATVNSRLGEQAVPLVCAAMKKFASNADLQRLACESLLSQLDCARDSELKRAVIAHDVVALLMKALRTHMAAVEVVVPVGGRAPATRGRSSPGDPWAVLRDRRRVCL